MASTPSTPPLGRDPEIAALRDLLEATRRGGARLCVVHGPPGAGASTLVAAAFADHPGTTRVTGLPWESEESGELARRVIRLLHGDVAPGADQGALVAALVDALTAARGDRRATSPLILVVEAAEHADTTSLRVLISAVHRLTDEPVLLVVVTRTPDGSAGVADLAAAELLATHPGAQIHVGPLSAADLSGVVAGAGVPLPTAVVGRLHAHTGGLPGPTVELLREYPPSRWTGWEDELPPTAGARRRLDTALARAADETVALVDAAAVLPQPAPLLDAGLVAGLPDAAAAIDEAQALGLLQTRTRDLQTFVGFPSRLLRAAALERLGVLGRRELHRRAAQVATDEGEILAHRARAALGPDPDLARELRAHARATSAHGAWEAAGHALLTAARLTIDRPLRRELLVEALDALAGAGVVPQAQALVGEVASLPSTARRDAALAYVALLRGRRAEAAVDLDRAWQACDPRADPGTAALVGQRHALTALLDWDAAGLVSWATRATRIGGPDAPAVLEAQAILGLGLGGLGRGAEARAACARAVELAGHGPQEQRARLGLAWLELALDEPAAAARTLRQTATTAQHQGSTRITMWSLGWLARAHLALGEPDAALDVAEQGMGLLHSSGIVVLGPLLAWTAAEIHALRGDFAAARAAVELAHSTPLDYLTAAVPAALSRATLAHARGEYPAVLRALEPVAARRRERPAVDEPGFWPWHDLHAGALVMLGRLDEADAFLTPLEAVARDRGHRSTIARLGLVRGRLHGARGDLPAARVVFDAADAALGDVPLPYLRARVLLGHGQTLRRAGKRRDSAPLLEQARDLFASVGALTYVHRCERELNASGAGTPRTEADPARAELTPQEEAVARLVARGRSNREVAAELFVSVKTVEYHLTRLYLKLGVRSRAELTALRHGTAGEGA